MQITVKNADGREETRYVSEGTTVEDFLRREMQINPTKVSAQLNGVPLPADALHTPLVEGAQLRLTVLNYNSGNLR